MSITFSAQRENSPELNLANANFRIISQLIQIASDEDDCGSIEAKVLEKKNCRCV